MSDRMKNRASKLLKQVIAALTSMAKSKTNAVKGRLIIFSLMKNKKLLLSNLSQKLHSLVGHHSDPKDECFLEDGNDRNKAIVVFNSNARSYEALPNPSETLLVGYEDEEYEDSTYPDLTHSLFDSHDLDFGGSVIDHVKNSKEEAGQEFKLEDEIDGMADLFIRKFRRQIILQKQDSLKRQQEMLQRGA